MSIEILFTSGVVVVVLFLIGLIFTIREFSEMNEHPESYRRDRSDEPKIIKKKKKDASN